MNTINNSDLFTEVTPDESTIINGGFTGLGGFDFQRRLYNPGIAFLSNPALYRRQLRFAQNQVANGLWGGFLRGGSMGQLGFTFGAAQDQINWFNRTFRRFR